VAGGITPSPDFKSLASAELWDPSTGTWSATGSMTMARTGHTAVLLSDGRVLIVGDEGNDTGAKAEIYDPKTGTFSPTASMNAKREGATATLLTDGRVLVVGGHGDNYNDLASAEIYQP
jgi:predicted amidohydrolase YtcJ